MTTWCGVLWVWCVCVMELVCVFGWDAGVCVCGLRRCSHVQCGVGVHGVCVCLLLFATPQHNVVANNNRHTHHTTRHMEPMLTHMILIFSTSERKSRVDQKGKILQDIKCQYSVLYRVLVIVVTKLCLHLIWPSSQTS